MNKPFEIVNLERELGGVELFVSSDENIKSSLKLNKTVIVDNKNNVIGFNLNYCGLEDLKPLQKFKNLEYLYLSNNEIVDINIIKSFKKLKILSLSSNKIEDIGAINHLKKIEELYLDNNKINIIPELYLPKLNLLFIYSNEIEDIDNLRNLSEIHFLNISQNKIKKIDTLKKFQKLEYLSASKNDITDISPLIEFRQLNTLDLSSNKIDNLMYLSNFESIGHLMLENNQIDEVNSLCSIEINELFIGENKIIDLTPLYSSLKTKKIQFININNSPNLLYPTEQITKMGEERIVEWFDMVHENLKKCRQKINNFKKSGSNRLDLGMMGLTDLSLLPELFELENLEELILSNVWAQFNKDTNKWEPIFSENDFYINNLINIPNDIIKLKKLKVLIAGGDWKKDNKWNRWRLSDISFINKLDNIEFVNLSNNKINSFKITRNLNELKTLHINNNFIKSISISRAKNIEYLFASNNFIEDVNFLKKSLSLKAIDLHSNLITDLYPIRELINRLNIVNDQWKYDSISIAKNNLENPGIEVVERGKEAVLRIIKSNFGIKTFKNNELKLILVGNSETGKTTLAKYFSNDLNYKDRHPFTRWMDILKIIYHGNVRINVFDFGGHEYFHDTHHIFFTKNCIYFLLWESKTDKYQIRDLNQIDENGNNINLQTIDYPILYWLDSIKHFIKDKDTDNFSEEMRNFIRENNSETYTSSSLIIQNKVSTRNEIKFINSYDISNNYPFIFDFINIDIHENKNLDLLNDRFNEMINNLGILSGGKYPSYYEKIKDNIFKNKSYLGKKIISFNEFKRLCQVFKRNLTTDDEFLDIAIFLKDIGLILISKDKKNIYLDLNFISNQIIKIYYGLENTNGILTEDEIKKKGIVEYENIMKLILDFNLAFEIRKIDGKSFIFPLYLPKKPSKLVQLLISDNLKIYKRIQYDGFMHKGIILHVFSEYNNKIVTEETDKNTYYWKNGLIVKEDKNLVLIKFFEGDETQKAHIDLYNFSDDEVFVEKIKEKIILLNKENNYDVKEYVSNNGDDFIPLKMIHDNEEVNSTILYNDKYYQLNNFKKYFKRKNIMKKVFISYSKYDDDYKREFVKHLITLKDENLIDPFNCDEIELGDNSHNVIQEKLAECDYMIALVSVDYLNTKYIRDFEIDKAEELGKKIIPIIIKPCDWENSKLGKYHATLRGTNISLDKSLFLRDVIKETSEIERAAYWNKIIKEFREKLFR